MISVTEALMRRQSIRAFLKKSISQEILKSLLEKAARSPSGGNLQPWHVYVIQDKSLKAFLDFQHSWKDTEQVEHAIYPEKLKEPYKSSRFAVGEQLYASLGISREDKAARIQQMQQNFEFFGAPAALFCFIDRSMGAAQWADLGMFLQSFMLLAQEENIDTCAQAFWATKSKMVRTFLQVDPSLMLYCGMSLGYRDPNSPLNQYQTARRPLLSWCHFVES